MLQDLIESASTDLRTVFLNLKEAKATLAEQEKELKKSMLQDLRYVELSDKLKTLKNSRKEMLDECKDIERTMDQMMAQTESVIRQAMHDSV